MKILMIAPEPFLEERGAPFAIHHHIKALLSMGFEVDLVTYHLGKPVDLPGLTILRIPAIPFIRRVKVGPSLAKIPLDILVFFLALRQLCKKKYAYLHTHEEAGLMGIILSAIFGCKHLYYMHSDLSQQIVSSAFTESSLLVATVRAVQAFMVRKADAVIAICPDIETAARSMSKQTPIYMIENSAVDESLPPADPALVARLRSTLRLGEGPVLLYTGTLESYQGIELLLHSIPTVAAIIPNVRYVFVGGQPDQVEEMSDLVRELDLREVVRFVGQRPLAEMPAYMALADVLLSPRTKGTNTPLKLYTYLRSGKPILATNIYSQTQVLRAETAMLVSPTWEDLAQGALTLLQHPEHAAALGQCGKQFAEEHYSWHVFLEKATAVQRQFTAEALPSLA